MHTDAFRKIFAYGKMNLAQEFRKRNSILKYI